MQIGPRIRVGGTVGKVGQKIGAVVEKATPDISIAGHKFALPGPMSSPIVRGVVAGAQGKDTSRAFDEARKANLRSAAVGAAALGGAAALPALGSAASGATASMGSLGSLGGIGGALKTAAPTLLGAGKKLLGGIPGLGGDGSSLLDKVLMGGSIAAGTEDNLRRRKLQDQSARYATDQYNAKAPVRARALAMLSKSDAAPDLSSHYADPGNPYDTSRRLAVSKPRALLPATTLGSAA